MEKAAQKANNFADVIVPHLCLIEVFLLLTRVGRIIGNSWTIHAHLQRHVFMFNCFHRADRSLALPISASSNEGDPC